MASANDELRYFVDARCGCVAVRDRLLTDPDYPGLHHYTLGVVWYRHGTNLAGVGWSVSAEDAKEAQVTCDTLNAAGENLMPLTVRLMDVCRKLISEANGIYKTSTRDDLERTLSDLAGDAESAIALARKGSDQTNNQVVAPGGGGGM